MDQVDILMLEDEIKTELESMSQRVRKLTDRTNALLYQLKKDYAIDKAEKIDHGQ